MAFIDWYVVLAIEPSASTDVVRKAYRRAALKYHPDKNPEAAAADQFDLLAQAVTVLSDAAKRAEFDRIRARRAVGAYLAASESARLRELRARLDGADSETVPKHPTNEELDRLRLASQEQCRALDALVERHSQNSSSRACRTLRDGSRTFETVAAARTFVDTHPGAALQASWRPPAYTREYEEATMDRLSRLSGC